MDVLEAVIIRRQIELWGEIAKIYNVDDRTNKQVRIWIHEKSLSDNAYKVQKKRQELEYLKHRKRN